MNPKGETQYQVTSTFTCGALGLAPRWVLAVGVSVESVLFMQLSLC